MKILLWIITLLIAFAAGYFAKSVSTEGAPVTISAQSESTQGANSSASLMSTVGGITENGSHRSAQTKDFRPLQNAPADVQPTQEKVIINESSGRQSQPLSKEELAAKYPNDISDEEIDRVIPPPFNTQLKNSHGGTREKYKDFVAASQPQNWDVNMQNKISDSILSSPYAKFITMDSLLCKANICEIRLYETKDNVWSLILAEMALRDWWEIGNYDSYGFATELDSKQITGYYILLTRR